MRYLPNHNRPRGGYRTVALGILSLTAMFAIVAAARSKVDDIDFATTSLVIEKPTGAATKFTVEVARTRSQLARGLMYRTEMQPDHGMIFVFDHMQPIRMWMKNTPLALDMLFVNGSGVVTSVVSNAPPYSESIIAPREQAQFVVELIGGAAEKQGIEPGDHVMSTVIKTLDTH